MSTFIEVYSLEKDCSVMINLDDVREIAPLATGGCILLFSNSSTTIRVKTPYTVFQQFAMQAVTVNDIKNKSKIEAKPELKSTSQK